MAATVGIVLDLRLVEQLYLRLATPLVELAYARGATETKAPDATSADSGQFSASVTLAPSIGVRVDF